MARLKTWTLVLITLALLGSFVLWSKLRNASYAGSDSVSVPAVVTAEQQIIAEYFAPLIPFVLGSTTLQVSVADTREARVQGLSGTPILPSGIGKLFVFESDDAWSIWMKDMQYPLDIIWLDHARTIVHVEENVSPDTYPESFSSPTPARYVLEVNASTTAAHGWEVGDRATW